MTMMEVGLVLVVVGVEGTKNYLKKTALEAFIGFITY